MLAGYSPEIQTLLGTLFTWGLTAAGAGLVFFLNGAQVSRIFSDFALTRIQIMTVLNIALFSGSSWMLVSDLLQV
jgi:hypothetical protein